MFGFLSLVCVESRLSEPSFRGETEGLPSRTLHAILRFLPTWPFKVCMTTDLGYSCCLNTVPSAFRSLLLKTVFIVWTALFTSPLDLCCLGDEVMCWDCQSVEKLVKSRESNWGPLSINEMSGIPCRLKILLSCRIVWDEFTSLDTRHISKFLEK